MADWEGLLDYLGKNQNGCCAYRKEPIHEDFLRVVMDNLDAIIMRQPSRLYLDVILLEENVMSGQVDAVAVSEEEKLYLIEVKVMRGKGDRTYHNIRRQIRKQLGRYYEYFARRFNVCAERVGVFSKLGKVGIKSFKIPAPEEDLIALGDRQ